MNKPKRTKTSLDLTSRGYVKRLLSLIVKQPYTDKGNKACRSAAAAALKEMR